MVIKWDHGNHVVHAHDKAGHEHLVKVETYFQEMNELLANGEPIDEDLRWRIAHHRQMAMVHFVAARVHPEWTEHNS